MRTYTFSVMENSFSSADQIFSLEHVVVKISLSIQGVSYYSTFDYDDIYDYYGDLYDWLENSHPRRGDIKIELTSPSGTNSILLPYRNYDFVNAEGYDNWPFMSIHFWGENPVGTWTLKITYKSTSGYVSMSGLSMTLHGTATVPTAVSSIPPTTATSQEDTNTTPSQEDTTTNDNTNSKKLAVAIGVPVGILVIAAVAMVSIVVYIFFVRKHGRGVRSDGFVQMKNEIDA